jgi:uncharacterized protein
MMGRFVWHDLLTADTKAATAFYTGLIGWKTQPFDQAQGPEPYTMWVSNQGPLGGVMPLQADEASAKMRPHWMGHVEVDDLDASVAKVKSLGGAVQLPPTEIPAVGRFSIVADPQGATLSLFQPRQSETPHDRSVEGEFNWSELHARDAQAAFSFYSELLGWKLIQELDMGPAGSYLIFGHGETGYGGMMNDPELPAPAWMYYVQVGDLDAAIARATSEGATLLYGPAEIPGGRMAHLQDPQGATFGLNA